MMFFIFVFVKTLKINPFTLKVTLSHKQFAILPPPPQPHRHFKTFDTVWMLLYPMSSPTLKNMDYKQEPLFNCEILGNLGWFYRFSRPMAAILGVFIQV